MLKLPANAPPEDIFSLAGTAPISKTPHKNVKESQEQLNTNNIKEQMVDIYKPLYGFLLKCVQCNILFIYMWGVFGAVGQVQFCCREHHHTEIHPEKAPRRCRVSFTRALPTLQRCESGRGDREGEKVATEESPRGPAGGRDGLSLCVARR